MLNEILPMKRVNFESRGLLKDIYNTLGIANTCNKVMSWRAKFTSKRPRTKNDQARDFEICFCIPVDHSSGSSCMLSAEGIDTGEYDGHHQKIPSCCQPGKTRG